ncbi:MAG: undecaprenyldiphospho-muramoylpentapeptide beta-N-acetylglucosaminyltransferase [Planctomycetota bacterium]|nr:undecaprenyldiphospho-muramoylpentapeptide beta-N-acetylglucosaminyltransferase [Planctomycetota bacterium]MDA1140750.1 undecaprenyldiphospho-muramoylpentapeptide beta-N-acetylglucosaminyltransferase [Planctomycetota bacterium]
MRCIFAAGGTGGHIQPAIALASELLESIPNAEVLFLGGRRSQETEWIKAAGFKFHAVECSPLGGGFRSLAAPPKVALGTIQCLRILRKFRPDAVVGFGGYTSFAPLLASYLLRVPRVLLEQNVLPGKTNRWMARLVNEVHSQWLESRQYIGGGVRFFHSGNPVRRSILEGVERLPGAQCLLVMGGSQGSEAVNKMMIEAAGQIGREHPELRIIHLTGPCLFEEVRQAYNLAGLQAEVHEYLTNMAGAYRRSSFALCRAGGTTIAELMAVGLPAILVPYPYAAEDHQRKNAMAVQLHGAGICLDEFATDGKAIADLIHNLLSSPSHLESLRQKTHSLAIPDASQRILGHLADLVHSNRESS